MGSAVVASATTGGGVGQALGVAPVAVLGLGNVLLGDDGFGPRVIELLQRGWRFPDSVEVIDVGTPGLDLVSYLLERKLVILVDAIEGGQADDEGLSTYRGDELQQLPMQPRVSPHDPALQEALWAAELADHHPEVILIGANPISLEVSTTLSPEMTQRTEAAARRVVDTLRQRRVLGVGVDVTLTAEVSSRTLPRPS